MHPHLADACDLVDGLEPFGFLGLIRDAGPTGVQYWLGFRWSCRHDDIHIEWRTIHRQGDRIGICRATRQEPEPGCIVGTDTRRDPEFGNGLAPEPSELITPNWSSERNEQSMVTSF